MNVDYTLDALLSAALAEGYSEQEISRALLGQAAVVGQMELVESKWTRQNVSSGGRITRRVVGPKNMKKRQLAIRAARKGMSKRRLAQRNPRTKMKRKRTMAIRRRMMPTKARRTPSRPARPKMRRPPARPKMRRQPRKATRRPPARRRRR